MKYCSNCGAQVIDGASFCTVCGNALQNNLKTQEINSQQVEVVNTQVQPSSVKKPTGAGTASLVLGILSTVFGVICLFIAVCIYSYYTDSWHRLQTYSLGFNSTRYALCIMLGLLPGVMSVIGLLLGLIGKGKKGSKIAGVILSLIGILLTVGIILLIMNI